LLSQIALVGFNSNFDGTWIFDLDEKKKKDYKKYFEKCLEFDDTNFKDHVDENMDNYRPKIINKKYSKRNFTKHWNFVKNYLIYYEDWEENKDYPIKDCSTKEFKEKIKNEMKK
jgi:hypothetical protein